MSWSFQALPTAFWLTPLGSDHPDSPRISHSSWDHDWYPIPQPWRLLSPLAGCFQQGLFPSPPHLPPPPEAVQACLLQCLPSPVFPHDIHLTLYSITSSRQPSLIAPAHSALPTLTSPFSPTHLPAWAYLTVPRDQGLRSVILAVPHSPVQGWACSGRRKDSPRTG